MQVLEEVTTSLEWRLPSFEPRVLLVEFGDSSINFEVNVWLPDPWISRLRLSELNLAIWRAFRERKIVIAFPQLDVHFDPPVTESIRKLARVGSGA
jgi:small-conductance mechanosensitive channel